jgi:hypothetical protein
MVMYRNWADLPRLGNPQNLALNSSGKLLQSNLAVTSGTGETAQTSVIHHISVVSDKELEQNLTMRKQSVGCGRTNCPYHKNEGKNNKR